MRDTPTSMDPATTKKVSEGKGLGLSVVHDIGQSLDDAIVVESTPRLGTVSPVHLPGTSAAATPVPAAPPVPRTIRSARIALVDDEPTVLAVLHRSLRILGHVPTKFSNGKSLLAALQADASRFDAVITDLTMPDIDGIALARALTALRSDLPIILTSGNTRSLDWKNAEAAGVRDLLEKPFSIQTLGDVMRRVLTSATSG